MLLRLGHALIFLLKVLQQWKSGAIEPAHRTAALVDIIPMLPADALRLRAEANVAVSGKRMRAMLQRLAKRRAAAAAAVRAGAHIQMGVDIDDARGQAGANVTQIMTRGRLVAAADNDGDGARLQHRGYDRAKSPLCVLQIFYGAEVTEVEESIVGETDALVAIRRRESIEEIILK